MTPVLSTLLFTSILNESDRYASSSSCWCRHHNVSLGNKHNKFLLYFYTATEVCKMCCKTKNASVRHLKCHLDVTTTNSNASVSYVHISTGIVDLVFKYLSFSINKFHLCLFSSEAEKAFSWHVFVGLITVLAKSSV